MRLAGLILAASIATNAYAQQRIENTRHGFTIEIPDTWHEAPDDFLTRFSRTVSNPNQRLRFIGAYQQASFDEGLVYPYVLIQTIPFRDFGLDRPPTPEERQQLFNEMTGLDVRDVLDATGSKDARALITGAPSIDNAAYSESSGAYTYDLRIDVAGIGAVKGRLRGTYGDWALLQAAYYAKDEDWGGFEPEAETILASFNSLTGTPEPDYETNSTLSAVMRGALRGAVGGAIIGGLVAFVAALGMFLYRQRSTPKPPPL